jgi:hypothetical protein
LFTRVRAFQQRAQQELGNPPAGVSVLRPLDGVRLLEKVQLFDLDGDKQTWPPPSTFAATFAQSMGLPLHAGQFWSDPEVQERRRAELAREQARNAAYHERTGREQLARQNRELKEQYLARQQRN